MRYYKEYLKGGFFVYDLKEKKLESWNISMFEPHYSQSVAIMESLISAKVGKRVKVGSIAPSSSLCIRVNKVK